MSPLAGLRVVDLSDGVAGQFATRMLADYGADTVLVEPPSGSALRNAAPLDPAAPDGEASLLFRHLNGGKQSRRLARPLNDSRDEIGALVADADVVVVDDPVLAEELFAACPQLVVCSITEFTGGGPYESWRGCELIHQALGGLMFMTGREGDEPLYGFGWRAYYSAGAAAAVAIMAALVERHHSGRGQTVNVSVHETAAAMSQHLVAQYAYNGSFPRRGVYPTGGVDTFRCRDGFIVLYCRADRWPALCETLGAPELGADPAFAPDFFARNWTQAQRRIAPLFSARTVAEALAVTVTARCVASKVFSAADVLGCSHLAARGYWRKSPDGHAALGPLFRMERRPAAAPSVRSGEGGCDDIRAEGDLPLAGVRIAELTTAWAGPMLGRILAELGAEVVKIESPAAMDVFRGPPGGGSPTQYPDGVAGREPFNRTVAFNSQNIGKRSVALDLKAPDVRPQVAALIGSADAVICNLAPRSLRGLGFDDASLRAIRPDIIMLEMPAAGSGGPLSDIAGVGHTMEALAGMSSLQAYADGEPQRTGPAYLDPIGALNGAVAVLIAIYARHRTGEGCHIELAQREAAMHWLGEWLLAAERGIAPPPPAGNARDGAAPHGAFRAQGEDQWIAIAVFSDAEFASLSEVLGLTLTGDPRFANLRARRENAAELGAAIEAATRRENKHDLAARLQARGVAAAPVANGGDLHGDLHLAATGFFVELDHPAAGRHRYHGLPFRFGAHLRRTPRPAPLLGQHTADILGN